MDADERAAWVQRRKASLIITWVRVVDQRAYRGFERACVKLWVTLIVSTTKVLTTSDQRQQVYERLLNRNHIRFQMVADGSFLRPCSAS